MGDKDFSRLSRPRYLMPDFIKKALVENNLLEAYEARPPYQQNDYVGWILQAKREETQQKCLEQMLEELALTCST
ncbi:MAG: YdeI/OmpD-associated family protein [Chloroflexota bacterium]|nr:YdeI/OmpD-associated family protein [Chloroflexota bacterium]